jgi:hypothetical protein
VKSSQYLVAQSIIHFMPNPEQIVSGLSQLSFSLALFDKNDYE